jgi:glycerol-3-phosphate dehydrogenase (NAD(P)+)
MTAAVADAGLVVLAAPSQYMRGMLTQLRDVERLPEAIYVNVAKGIEVETLKRPQQIVAEVLGEVRYTTLSGPSHAEEVANHLPTAVVCASPDPAAAETVQMAFMTPFFRVYTAADVIGVELGGSLKNVFALAAGICDGMGFGDNSKAALITRGIVEMARLGQALGGQAETFSGLSGVGDLIVTCISQHSRNRHVGEELGKGRKLADIQSEMGMTVAEGVKTCISAYELAHKHGVMIPVIDEVYAALYQDKNPQQAARDLMMREARPENDRA